MESLEEKHAEVKLALYVACHTSINAVDHLTDVCKVAFHGNSLTQNLHLHITKCTCILNNVLAPYFQHTLTTNIENSFFSLIIDESTDISVKKFLGLIIIYFSESQNQIVTTFLDMPQLFDFSASGIVEVIKKILLKYNLKLNNLIGIGTDNASVMTGVNNGVYVKLKEEIPNLILIRCICHSLQLATSSSSRQNTYKNLYKTINNNEEPLKIVSALSCKTRWLSIEIAVSRIVDQWLELKTHFQISRNVEKCYTAETLYCMYSDDKNYAFLSFLKTVLQEVQRVNKLFECVSADPTKLIKELNQLITILTNKIVLPSHHQLDIFKHKIEDYVDWNCYLGFKFETIIRNLKDNKHLLQDEECALRKRVINFVIALIEELKTRLPENLDIMNKVSYLSYDVALNHNKPSLISLLKFFGKKDDEIDIIENKWRMLHLINWNATKDTKQFWYEVYNFKDASNENPFKPLASFAVMLLTLPISNAEVERLFSQLNLIKTKIRNKLSVTTTNSILRIRYSLKQYNKCCHNYDIPNDIIKKIKTNETYKESHEDYDLDLCI